MLERKKNIQTSKQKEKRGELKNDRSQGNKLIAYSREGDRFLTQWKEGGPELIGLKTWGDTGGRGV